MSADAIGPPSWAPPPGKPASSSVPGKPGPTRATGADLEARLDQIERLDLAGASYLEIAGFAAKSWGVTRRQTSRYLLAVRERYMHTYEADRAKRRARRLLRLERLGRKAEAAGELAAAIAAERTAARIEGSEFHPDLDLGESTRGVVEMAFDLIEAPDEPGQEPKP